MRSCPSIAWLAFVACTPLPPSGPSDAGSHCGAGLTDCGGTCVSLLTSNDSCGDCGRACPSDQRCAHGACAPAACGDQPCWANEACLGGLCVDRFCIEVQCTDGRACAAGLCLLTTCGNATCDTGAVCIAGECADTSCVAVLCGDAKRCLHGACVDPSCVDGQLNGDETDIDCGGSCVTCPVGAHCSRPQDCGSSSCVSAVCAAAQSCNDGQRDGREAFDSCGGGACDACPRFYRCDNSYDCDGGNACRAGVCGPPCDDGQRNGDETDVDCGGSCPRCGAYLHCSGDPDCTSGSCDAGFCAPDAG